jgi:hypothetical protein
MATDADAASAVAAFAAVAAAIAAPLPLKNCTRCGRGQPASAFSGAQLKLGASLRRLRRNNVDLICGLCDRCRLPSGGEQPW